MDGSKKYIVILLCLMAFKCGAQQKKIEESAVVDLNLTGVNKILCMKNGNTMLFHFEPGKRITVKVFDVMRKQIASQQEKYSILDVFTSEHAVFKGLFEINNEAVLFIDQDHSGKHELVRVRYNALNGTIAEEKLVAQSQNENKRMRFYVMKNKEDDNYEIFFCTDIRHPVKQCDLNVVYFNGKHESLRDIQLDVDRQQFDYLEVLGAETQPNGLLVTIGLDTTTIYGRPNHNHGALVAGGSVYEHYVSFYYIPNSSYKPHNCMVDVTAGVFPYYTLYSYNPFARSLNSLLFSYKPLYYKFGQNLVSGKVSSSLFFKIGEDDMSIGFNRIKNANATDFLIKQTDTSNFFDGIPVKMFTNENGLSTLFYQSDVAYGEPETRVKYDFQDFLGNIGITQFDDDGNELWGTVLPLAQYCRSHKHYYAVRQFAKRWQAQAIFEDSPPEVYDRQFVSFNAYAHDKNYYIIYNDGDKNFNNSLAAPGDTVYNFESTNACYYKISSKKEISKNYLFGQPGKNEYRCSFIEGADYDEQRNIYATLVQYKKGDNITLHMAWSHLD